MWKCKGRKKRVNKVGLGYMTLMNIPGPFPDFAEGNDICI